MTRLVPLKFLTLLDAPDSTRPTGVWTLAWRRLDGNKLIFLGFELLCWSKEAWCWYNMIIWWSCWSVELLFYFFDLLLVALAGAFVYIPSFFFFNHPSCRRAVGQPARYWAQQLLCREASATRRVIANILRQLQAVLRSIKRGRCADATNFGKLCCKLMDDILMISCMCCFCDGFLVLNGFDPFPNYIPKKSSGEWREQFRVMGIQKTPIFIEKPVGARDSQPHDMGYGWFWGSISWMDTNQHKLTIVLVGGFKHFLFSIRYGIILPIDVHIFQDG